MPEGHTLHRLAADLTHAFAGTAPAASSPQGRFAEGAALLSGRTFLECSAWGKHVFSEFAGEVFLNVHLGLIGRFDVLGYAGAPPPPVGAVRLRLLNAAYVADLRAATHVVIATPDEVEAVIARLGPDPLRPIDDSNDPERAWARISRSGRSIADLMMDQAVLAGLGNVYRSEILFRHRVDPHRPGRQLRRRTWEAIWADALLLLPIGVQLGQIITMTDQVEAVLAGDYDVEQVPEAASGVSAWRPNPRGALERRFYVYQRQGEPCRVCGSRIRTAVVAGRNLFWCGRCQRRG